MRVEELINYGIVNIDKPSGPTSHQVADFVQKILGIKKAGHSGTLDPKVTGILVLGLSRATRLVHVLLTGGKEYVGIMHLHKLVDEKEIKKTVKKFFVGKIKQTPPIKSAVKREEREREIYEFEVLEVNGQDVLFRVSCQAGTYIRKLCHDLGKQLGVGAHMAELRRTRVGPFDESTTFTLQDLKDAYVLWKEEGNEKFIRRVIQPVESVVKNLPKVKVNDGAKESLLHGRDLAIPGIAELSEFVKDDVVALMNKKGELIGLGTAAMSTEEIEKKKKGIAVRTEKVFMRGEEK
ncbi:RNA-guided pseudouridylation complex pseudouridine synthase subunit Cbf5 [Candidatus Woesearchaeota archaeon]|nr:RNA-guided pseudouridylation complex pseudouridine synthase subunit Cbf5 [Candidatus Woesearchaeota archaeon]